jgi:poly-gamma-glutamate synthesis protein (capsule biosynthesis protein)
MIYYLANKGNAESGKNDKTAIVQTTNTDPGKVTNNIKSVKISAVGDILLGRGVGRRIVEQNKTYSSAFEDVREILKYGDVIFGNLEEPFTDSTKGLLDFDNGGKFVLKSEPKAMEGIVYGGFNLVSLANNHIMDYYTKGLYDTTKLLDKEGIAYAGAGKNIDEARKLSVIEKNGVKIGLLAYTEMAYLYYDGDPDIRFVAEKNRGGVAPYDVDFIKKDIKKARGSVDVLIVSLHFGTEYSLEPQQRQINETHSFVDAGADIIIGHHSHQDQGIEIYNGKPIFYSLGNFIFDQNDPISQRSFIINMELTNNKLSSLSAIPVQVLDKMRVVKVTGELAKEMIERERKLSVKLNSKCESYNNTLKFNLN